MRLFWTELGSILREHLKRASEHVYILAPFIQPDTFTRILPPDVPATVVTSWRADHLRDGVSSLALYGRCRDRPGTTLLIHPRIHLKAYGYDLTREWGALLIGSANVTGRGLGYAAKPNMEVLGLANLTTMADRARINRLIAEALLVDDAVYQTYVTWMQDTANQATGSEDGTSGDPFEDLNKGQFLVTHLPLSDSPLHLWSLVSGQKEPTEWWEMDAAVHDLALYGDPDAREEAAFLEILRQRFFAQPFVRAFLEEISEEGLYFGRIKEWIQANCHDVPTPRRRELTVTVQSLLAWIVSLDSETFELVRPSHSQCLRRRRGRSSQLHK